MSASLQKTNGYELIDSPIYRYTGFYSDLTYLFATPFKEQAGLLDIDGDNAMLEVDDKQQLFRCYSTKQSRKKKKYQAYYLLSRTALLTL